MGNIDGIDIRTEREIARDTVATQIRLAAVYCGQCGSRLVNGKCEYRCGDNDHQTMLGQFYAKRITRACPGCGATIHPKEDAMIGRNWWNEPTRNWIFHCESCGDGKLEELALAQIAVEPTFPDYDGNPQW